VTRYSRDMNDTVERFVTDLAAEFAPTLINQYAVEVPGIDGPRGASIRRANLRAYLEPRIGRPLALIGEAPSAHGARFSGIAFTAERSLPPERWTSAPGLRAGGFTEHSATVLGRAMGRAGVDPGDVILWNAVPFHPARDEDPLRNRRPTAGELTLGAHWLARFLALMRPGLVVAVGQTAGQALPAGTPIVRHPANGGSRQLQLDLARLAIGLGYAAEPRDGADGSKQRSRVR
jgi:uracil-DNA glycosylase